MTMTISGPMFMKAKDECGESIYNKEGLHYNIYKMIPEKAIGWLKELFPEGEAGELNFCLFSTSGIHGSYVTIESFEQSLIKYGDKEFSDEDMPDDWHGDEITFLVIHPRVVAMKYGNAKITLDDIPFLKKLRQSSCKAVSKIGFPTSKDAQEGSE